MGLSLYGTINIKPWGTLGNYSILFRFPQFICIWFPHRGMDWKKGRGKELLKRMYNLCLLILTPPSIHSDGLKSEKFPGKPRKQTISVTC